MRIRRRTAVVGVVLALMTAACADRPSSGPKEVVLVAYDAFTPADGIFDRFTEETGVKVRIVTAGDTGTMVSKAILTAGKPEGDVMWGIDNTFLSRAQRAEVLESFEPVDEGDICVNYDKNWFASRALAPPRTFDDLVAPEYAGLLVTQDPTASSPGLGFLLATVARYGNDGWQDYWRRLLDNDVTIVSDWTTAYTVEFSGSSGKGKHPLVVSYGSSPPAEVVYAATPVDEPPTAVIESTCFRQTEYVGILRGSPNTETAQKLIDYLLDVPFQESMPLSLFVFPVNPQASLPKVFTDFAVRPTDPLTIAPDVIEKNRDSWLDAWRALAL